VSSFIPTCVVTILRQRLTYNEYGDETDAHQVKQTGVPAHMAEREKTTFEPTSGRYATVRYKLVLLPPQTDVKIGDRLVDESDGQHYSVDDVYQRKSFAFPPPLRVDATWL